MNKNKIVILLLIILIMIISSTIATYIISSHYSINNETNNLVNVNGKMNKLYEPQEYQQIRELIYPVGSIYISVTDSSVQQVQARFGGTWEEYAPGKALFGVNTSETEFNTIGKTGGEKTHKLTISEMPRHRHFVIHSQWFGNDAVQSSSTGAIYSWRATTGGTVSTKYRTNATDLSTNSNDMLTTGGNGAHNNLSPYITVYIYRRTA